MEEERELKRGSGNVIVVIVAIVVVLSISIAIASNGGEDGQYNSVAIMIFEIEKVPAEFIF